MAMLALDQKSGPLARLTLCSAVTVSAYLHPALGSGQHQEDI